MLETQADASGYPVTLQTVGYCIFSVVVTTENLTLYVYSNNMIWINILFLPLACASFWGLMCGATSYLPPAPAPAHLVRC
jgi:hypothetical protein